ncbi:MAG: hypothetical protein RIB84_01005 [Sneathiellaceae bacterium]
MRKAVASPLRIAGVSPVTGCLAVLAAFLGGIVSGEVLAGVAIGTMGYGLAALASHREPHIDIVLQEWGRRLLAVPGRGMRGYPPARMPRLWGDRANRYDA